MPLMSLALAAKSDIVYMSCHHSYIMGCHKSAAMAVTEKLVEMARSVPFSLIQELSLIIRTFKRSYDFHQSTTDVAALVHTAILFVCSVSAAMLRHVINRQQWQWRRNAPPPILAGPVLCAHSSKVNCPLGIFSTNVPLRREMDFGK